MKIEWDEKKNKENTTKHGVDFKEASEIFDDPFCISILDKRFDYSEERWISLGCTADGKLLVTGYAYYLAENVEERIRIITARRATKKEREQYEEVKKRERFRA
ncbi:MAG: BrnT family toxin [Nitrospirae bacterium]|nr:BrnT family toxin [Nitrospirota bacterium]